ncbi:MAG: flavin reductase family protein [Elusimicrobia bacterium]|nr:flavin reductase family protein [Elusimicrobiota bacterium]
MRNMEYFENFDKFCGSIRGGGAFLVVEGPGGKPNVMTIGWGTIGVVWYRPIVTVMVRPSRYTFTLIEQAKHFSVNVPVGKFKDELNFCGTHSGRDVDKIAKCNLAVAPGKTKGVSVIKNCDLIYECEIVHKTKVDQKTFIPDIIDRYYPKGDFHTIYFGQILHAYRP